MGENKHEIILIQIIGKEIKSLKKQFEICSFSGGDTFIVKEIGFSNRLSKKDLIKSYEKFMKRLGIKNFKILFMPETELPDHIKKLKEQRK